MALFSDGQGNIIEQEDNYDPDTGENLAVSDFVNKVKQRGGNVTPVNIFQDDKGQRVAVPLGQEDKFTKLGLKPLQQIQAEQSAQEADAKVKSGDIGYTPNMSDTGWSKLGNALSLKTSPDLSALEETAQQKLGGSKDSLSDLYNTNRNAYQSVLQAQQKAHPIESGLAEGIGQGALLVPGGGMSAGSQMGLGALLGGASQANEAVNQQKPLSSVGMETAAGGAGGALGVGGGLAVNNALKGAVNIVKPLLPKEAPTFFQSAVKGENFADPNVRASAFNDRSSASEGLANNIDDVRKLIGTQKGENIQAQGSVDHSTLLDKMQSAIDTLNQRKEVDLDPDVQTAIDRGLNRLKGNFKSLINSPNNPKVIDQVKVNLGKDLFDNNGNKIIEDYGVRETMDPVRKEAQQLLEKASAPSANLTPGYKDTQLGNINKAYQDVLTAQNPQDFFKNHTLTPEEIENIGKGEGMSGNTLMKLNNIKKLNENLKNNPDLSLESKQKLDDFVNKIENVARRANLSKAMVDSKGIPGVVNRAASSLGDNMKWIDGLPDSIKNSPYFKQILPTLGGVAGQNIGTSAVRPYE